jgi:hypothetical protein
MSIYRNKSKQDLVKEIENALDAVSFGSVEIYVQDDKVTQITVRNIKKTSINIKQPEAVVPETRKEKIFTLQAHIRRTQ